MKRQILAIAAFALACAEGMPVQGYDTSPQLEAAPIGGFFDDCSRNFSPESRTLPYTIEAVDRWSRATGCDIHISGDGIPVLTVPEIVTVTGKKAFGLTSVNSNCEPEVIYISEKSLYPYATTTHEVGHALASMCGEGPAVHTNTGIMAERITSADIDEASLALVCTNLPCVHMETNSQNR